MTFTSSACRRCNATTDGVPDMCWWCSGPLCNDCWDRYGHCGHEQVKLADELGELARNGVIEPLALSELVGMQLEELRERVRSGRAAAAAGDF